MPEGVKVTADKGSADVEEDRFGVVEGKGGLALRVWRASAPAPCENAEGPHVGQEVSPRVSWGATSADLLPRAAVGAPTAMSGRFCKASLHR